MLINVDKIKFVTPTAVKDPVGGESTIKIFLFCLT